MESYRGYCSYNLRESRASVLTKAYHTEHILNFWITSIRTTPIDGLYREDSAALSYCRIESSFVSGRVVSLTIGVYVSMIWHQSLKLIPG